MTPFLVTIRTADRRPKPNYLGKTVRAFIVGGVPAETIHVFPTSPDVAWLAVELGDLPVVLHVPTVTRTPNQNGLAQVTALDQVDAEWIGLFEDDLAVCADPVGSMTRWLRDHARPSVQVYRFFALPGTPLTTSTRSSSETPLREMRGSQAVALRAAEARDFAQWASEHHTCWRPKHAPFQTERHNGFDKLIGYWALARWPSQPHGLLSRPMMVKHIGDHSSLHRVGLRNDAACASSAWSYRGATA